MSTYKEDEYTFFTTKENYETMALVANKIKSISERLTKEFWEAMSESLSSKFDKSNGWVVEFSSKFKDRYCKLQVYNEEWTGERENRVVAIAFQSLHFSETPFLGILINKDDKRYDLDKIREEILKIGELKIDSTDNDPWWITQRSTGLNFTNYENLTDIVPSERVLLIENLTAEVLEIGKLLGNKIDSLLSGNKLSFDAEM